MQDYQFPSPSWRFAAAVFNARRADLISPDQYERLLTVKGEGLIRVLHDIGYGRDSGSVCDSVESLTDASIKALRKLVADNVPDTEVTDLFFAEYDAHNLKVLLKAKLTNRTYDEISDRLSENGRFGCDILRACVEFGDYSILGKSFECLSLTESLDDAQEISAAVDNAIWQYVFSVLKSKHIPLLQEYFTLYASYTNALTRMRAERLGMSESRLSSLLIPGIVTEAVPKADTVEGIETERSLVCTSLLSQHRNDIDGWAVVAHYINVKLNEVRNIRLIDALGAEAAGLLNTLI